MSNGVTPIIGRRTALRTILIFYGYDDEGEDKIEIAGQRENMNLKNKSSEKMEMFEMRLCLSGGCKNVLEYFILIYSYLYVLLRLDPHTVINIYYYLCFITGNVANHARKSIYPSKSWRPSTIKHKCALLRWRPSAMILVTLLKTPLPSLTNLL